MTYSIFIKAGTKVLGKRSGLIELRNDVQIDNAKRLKDGAFIYKITGGDEYICSAGCCEFELHKSVENAWVVGIELHVEAETYHLSQVIHAADREDAELQFAKIDSAELYKTPDGKVPGSYQLQVKSFMPLRDALPLMGEI